MHEALQHFRLVLYNHISPEIAHHTSYYTQEKVEHGRPSRDGERRHSFMPFPRINSAIFALSGLRILRHIKGLRSSHAATIHIPRCVFFP